MKKTVALLLALALVAMGCAFAEEEIEPQAQSRLRLGSSVYTLTLEGDFVAGELSDADIAQGQIGCYQDDDTGLELDVYQIPKAEEDGIGAMLDHYTLRLADAEEHVEVVWPTDEVNGIDLGWYWCRRTRDDIERDVAVYCLDGVDSFIQLVFWPADEVGMQVLDIVDTVDFMSLKEISLGTSRFTMLVPDDYRLGEITDADIADDQVAYWYSDASLLDFDVYQFSKEGCAPTLAEYVVEESAAYPAVSELVTDGEINLIPVAWYRAVDECDEGEYDTITYIIDSGDEYVEVVFWLDGPTAEAEADYMIHNLIDGALLEEDDEAEDEADDEAETENEAEAEQPAA